MNAIIRAISNFLDHNSLALAAINPEAVARNPELFINE